MNSKNKRVLFYVLGLISVGFLFLTIIVSLFPSSLLDKEFSEEVQEHHYPFLDTVMQVISWPGTMPNSLFMVLISSGIFMFFKYKREALFLLLTLLSGAVSHSMKIIVNRPRPTKDIVRVVKEINHQSFPSGHVLFYVIFFGFIIVLMNHLNHIHRMVRLPIISACLFLIFTVPFSRIYLGAHWFTDVAGGFLLGLLLLFILSSIYLRKQNMR